MNTKTVSEMIIDYLARTPKEWIAGGTLERNVTILHKPATVSRTLRELAEQGIIFKDYMTTGRRYVIYRYKKYLKAE